MAPPNSQRRVKGISVYRPFIYGTTAKPFDPVKNPKPEGTPPDHTHSWTVFVKGVDNADITYWLKKVQFKLHESIPNPLRSMFYIAALPRVKANSSLAVEASPGQPFTVSETGWGEFEMQIKLHYTSESNEKPQTLWHHLRLHPYGTDEEKAKQAVTEVRAWCYEEQIFNEPYEAMYDILTNFATTGGRSVGGKGGKAGATVPSKKEMEKRNATIPARPSPDQPYARETEVSELRKLREAGAKVDEQQKQLIAEVRKRELVLQSLKAEVA